MLTLAVTANDLRMGQGYVRCGRCANVFNALLALSEEPVPAGGAAAGPAGSDRTTTSQLVRALQDMAPTPAAASISDQAPPPSPPAAAKAKADAPAPPPAGAALHLPTEQSSDGAIENESTFADGTGTFETIVLEGEAITQTEEYVPEESVDSELAALTKRLGRRSDDAPVDGAEPAANAADEGEPGEGEPDEALAEESEGDAAVAGLLAAGGLEPLPEIAGTRRARAGWIWTAGSVALLLLLALQAVHHWRDALAVSPPWNALLTRAYAAIGVPLDPHWDLRAYDVRQQGAVADPNDSQLIRVRLSLANHAARPQPPPLLRLTLLDRYGKRISSGELTPEQYWPAGVPPRQFLAHDERIDSQLAVRDPSGASASFELDVCLRGGGGVRCAGDLPPTSPPVVARP